MRFINKKRYLSVFILLSIIGSATNVTARPNVNMNTGGLKLQGLAKTTASGCNAATAAIDLDINNVRARLMTGGDMWWNLGTQTASYEVPKGSGKSSQFAASCWIGGFDAQGQLKVAGQTYRQSGNDYWPGILSDDGSNAIDQATCSDWDKFWKVNKSDINAFRALSGVTIAALKTPQFEAIRTWPASGNPYAEGSSGGSLNIPTDRSYAPFVDVDKDGRYDPTKGDYPLITGDQYIWWVFNDKGASKQMSLKPAIGLEVQTSSFAYSSQDFLNNATFINYRVINRGSLQMDSTYIAVWDDADLGYAFDDFIGCDTNRRLGIEYNGTSFDGTGQPNSYGASVPQCALDFFQGPKKTMKLPSGKDTVITLEMTNFTYYNNDFSSIGNPTDGNGMYNYMTGSILDGSKFSNDFQGHGITTKGYGKGPAVPYIYWGDPSDLNQWSECACGNLPADRRMIFSAGPFTLVPGALNDITVGCIWAAGVGGCPNTNFKSITAIDDQVQALFANNFKTIEGPNAPNLTVRELDRHLVFYIDNPWGSNNYKEQFGRSDSLTYHQASIKASKLVKSPDSLYKFQGYRVFQLANSSVSAADIYGSDGQIDPTKAVEVFQCDIHDSITRIVNYVKNTTISDSTWVPQIKVSGRDSGIVHSFTINTDAFATGNDKGLVNYKSYYFVAVAYAYNDFSYDKVHRSGGFNPRRADSTQDVPYLESSHAAGGGAIQIATAIPNPAYGDFGTILNADYNTGVSITRIAGTGNGGNTIEMDNNSVANALNTNIVKNPVYLPGQGPVDVKVVDPVKVKPMNWEIFLNGPLNDTDRTRGIKADSGTWVLVGTPLKGGSPVTIYSERSIKLLNEQILADYGLSVAVGQVNRPSDDQDKGNGYITSSVSYADQSKAWLAGVQDGSDSSLLNWIRSGNNIRATDAAGVSGTKGSVKANPCNFNDLNKLDTFASYSNLLSNNSFTARTWAPYGLVAPYLHATGQGSLCGFSLAPSQGAQPSDLFSLPSVNLVFTSDKSKWTRCVVLEMQEDPSLAEGRAAKFAPRSHASWNLDVVNNMPVYSTLPNDTGMSWFPGYAINEETGERLNIVFAEDSWLKSENGADMIWNPTSRVVNTYDASILFGGKHFVYVLGTRYDKDSAFVKGITNTLSPYAGLVAFKTIQWAGIPLVNPNSRLLSLDQNLIPTETTLRFRVTRPYAFYNVNNDYLHYTFAPNNPDASPAKIGIPAIPKDTLAATLPNKGLPYYAFTTQNLAPTPSSDVSNKNALLDRILAVPNPYYGYAGYEKNRFDTRVRIINLPPKATVNIFSLDGTLIRTLTKSDATVSYLDWDIRNAAGLPIASGMYLMDVKAEGIGEVVLRWFGAMRPIDITTY